MFRKFSSAFFPSADITEEQAQEMEHALQANPEVDVFDSQNPAMLGLSLVAQAGLVGSFVAMSAKQKVENAFRNVKARIHLANELTIPENELLAEKSSPQLSVSSQRALGSQTANIHVCTTGEEANEWKLKLLRAATQSIEISGNYCGGKCFREALEIIRDKLQQYEELQVHILSSPELLQSPDVSLANSITKEFPARFHFLQTKTICKRVFRSGEGADLLESRENHVKLVVVDDYYFVAGGTNFEEHLGTRGEEDQAIHITSSMYERFVLTASRDMDVAGAGAIAPVLRERFFDLFKNWVLVMGHKYFGEAAAAAKRSKREILEENEELKKQLHCLREDNRLLSNKIDEIRMCVQNGEDLAPLLESDQNEVEECDWHMVEDPNRSLNISSDIVSSVQRAFIPELELVDKNPKLVLNVPVRGLFSSRIFHNNEVGRYESSCTEEYIRAIDDAKASIRLAHLNVNPASRLMESILNAVKRGVKVELITTAADATTPLAAHFYAWANRVNYLPIMTGEPYLEDKEQAKEQIKHYVSVYEYAVSRTTYHKKVAIIDNETLLIGSYNMSQKSHNGDDELLLAITSSELCTQVNEVLNFDIDHSNPITSAQALQYYFSWKSRFLSDLQSGRVAKLV
eukprot:CAMPEP_0206191800 /NCGR_PEP_ID=MMETSP0166-20121206/5571_1 /ASSEMBLY_ACC=CAM_ASM_000260 /TAXON_ID=95228 /ORGANISM="Vannella robusta, Strain DIVA3 518/3/11/1/6" /LENGTH=630 /DNA_ID=CAMNT_0053608159 /DNA_START=15 /DNA_END=1903 /DNA_ORIENTATION=+